jgi:hypothetical protein
VMAGHALHFARTITSNPLQTPTYQICRGAANLSSDT